MSVPRRYLRHNIETGFHRLIEAPRDLRAHDVFAPVPLEMIQARHEYRGLHARYVEQIRWAIDRASEWWVAIVDNHVEQVGGDFDEGLTLAYSLWPAGASAGDQFVSTIRDFWLAVVDLGRRFPPEQRVAPETLMLGWLPQDSDLVAVITGMPYWPIGLDENGEWC